VDIEHILRDLGLILGAGLVSQLIATIIKSEYFFGGLLVMFVFIFVARPITVLACLLPDRRGGWMGREMAFISWCRETGVIPAAVASLLLSRGVEGAEIAVSMVALAVCTTLLLQATTAGYVARRLGLLDS
jgi:cell volume regulation protein A